MSNHSAKLFLAILGVLSSSLAIAQPASPVDVACSAPNSAFDCAKAIKTAIRSATTTAQVLTAATNWNSVLTQKVEGLRQSSFGLVKSKSDMQLIRAAISSEIPSETDAARLFLANAPGVPGLLAKWKAFWSKYLGSVSAFLNSPIVSSIATGLKASLPSEIATEYDDLLSTNSGVVNAVYLKLNQLDPPPGFIATMRDAAYERARATLQPSFQAAAPPPR